MAARLDTRAASNAFFRLNHELGSKGPGFRIAAPGAPQGTPFQKHQGPYARTIMDGKLLNIENRAFQWDLPSLSHPIFLDEIEININSQSGPFWQIHPAVVFLDPFQDAERLPEQFFPEQVGGRIIF